MLRALSAFKIIIMNKFVFNFCIIGSLIVGAYVANIFYKNHLATQLYPSFVSELTVEKFKELPHEMLAEYAKGSQSIRVSQNIFAKIQQDNLRQAVFILTTWSLLLLVIVFSQAKALNKALLRTA